MKNYYILLFLGLFVWSQYAIGQQNEAALQAGDTLYLATDNIPNIFNLGEDGTDKKWDLTTLQTPFARQLMVQSTSQSNYASLFPESEVYLRNSQRMTTFFSIGAHTLTIVGALVNDPFGYNTTVVAKYSTPYLVRDYEAHLYDIHEFSTTYSIPVDAKTLPISFIKQFPIRPDSFLYKIDIERFDIVDAEGVITIPGGIFDVLREKRSETKTTSLWAKIGGKTWIDVSKFWNGETGKTTSTEYHFWNKESKEPIAVVAINPTNNQVTQVEYKANDITFEHIQLETNIKPGIYAYPNPAIVNVRFAFFNLPDGNYTLRLSNILGRTIWQKEYYINQDETEKMNVLELNKGTYLYSLTDKYGKVLMTKRLIIVRP